MLRGWLTSLLCTCTHHPAVKGVHPWAVELCLAAASLLILNLSPREEEVWNAVVVAVWEAFPSIPGRWELAELSLLGWDE